MLALLSDTIRETSSGFQVPAGLSASFRRACVELRLSCLPSMAVLEKSRAKSASPPPLQQGDMLTRSEFERRYAAMPHLKKAELIDG